MGPGCEAHRCTVPRLTANFPHIIPLTSLWTTWSLLGRKLFAISRCSFQLLALVSGFQKDSFCNFAMSGGTVGCHNWAHLGFCVYKLGILKQPWIPITGPHNKVCHSKMAMMLKQTKMLPPKLTFPSYKCCICAQVKQRVLSPQIICHNPVAFPLSWVILPFQLLNCLHQTPHKFWPGHATFFSFYRVLLQSLTSSYL